jgi:hypothetical protein
MIRELIDTELEAVAGGFLDFGNHVFNNNFAPQFSQAFGGNANNGSIGGSALSFNIGPTQTNQTKIGG